MPKNNLWKFGVGSTETFLKKQSRCAPHTRGINQCLRLVAAKIVDRAIPPSSFRESERGGRWRLRGSQLIKLLIVDCKCRMRDSCRRGCVAHLKQGWLLIIPGKCCPSPAWSLLWSLPAHHRPVVPPLYIV